MRDKPRSTSRRTLRTIATVLAAGVGLAAIYSCSLIVETQSQQCTQDSDCAMFGNAAKCNKAAGACECTGASCSLTSSSATTTSTTGSNTSTTTSTSTTTTSSTSSTSGGPTCDVDGGIAGGGCYNDSLANCLATTNSELLNACTTGCTGFDNAMRIPTWDGGALPLLPMPGPDGGF
jgi:hypothetical protein